MNFLSSARIQDRLLSHPLFIRMLRAYFVAVPVNRGKTRLRRWIEPALARQSYVEVLLDGHLRVSLDIRVPGERTLFFHDRTEPEEELFQRLLLPGMTAFDVGANIGIYTLRAACKVGPTGAVHSFEPCPANYKRLQANVELNAFSNVVINQAAVSDGGGSVSLYVYDGLNSGKHSLSLENASSASVEVRCVTLDDYVLAKTVPAIDVMKIDVEGAEYLVLAGANRLLSCDSQPVLFCEVSDPLAAGFHYSSREVKDLLSDYGYQGYTYADGRLLRTAADHYHDCDNLVFFTKRHCEKFGHLRNLVSN